MTALNIPSIEAIQSARKRLAGTILRTPLIKFDGAVVERSDPEPAEGERSAALSPSKGRNASVRAHLPLDYEPRNVCSVLRSGTAQIYLKLENLQPTGSFKVRGAGNALLSAKPSQLKNGVWTASAGNMGQALAWYAQKHDVACTVVVPNDAPEVKVKVIEQLGASILKVPFADYQAIQRDGSHADMKGCLIHPFADEAVMAGNGTIGLEILEDLPDVDTVLVPYGGGGLSCGIAAAIKASRPGIRVEAVEVATATPLTGSLVAGKPVEVAYQASFISGMGAPFVFPQMWPLASQLLDGSRVVALEQVAEAIRLLAERHHIIVEGAGAVAFAAALAEPPGKKIVCVVSGGNIAAGHLTKILQGELP